MSKSKEDIVIEIKRVLEEECLYSPILDFSIENYAQVCFLKSIAYEDAISFSYGGFNDDDENKGRSVVIELSREGDRRFKVNPAHSIFLEHSKECQKILDSLCMTAKSSNTTQNDDFEELKDKMRRASE